MKTYLESAFVRSKFPLSSQRGDSQNARVTTLILQVISKTVALNPLPYSEWKHFSLFNAVAKSSNPLAQFLLP